MAKDTAQDADHAKPIGLAVAGIMKNSAIESTSASSEAAAAADERLAAWDRDRIRAEWAERWEKSGVMPRHRNFRVADVDASKPDEGRWLEKLAICRKQMGTGCLLALVGLRGNGKTQMAVELIREACLKRNARYATAMDFFMDVKAAYREDGADERSVIDRFVQPDLLVLDEAHERGNTDWEGRLLTYLMDQRYGKCKDTVLIANMSREAFVESVGPSIASRMSETGGVVECDWGSFR